MREDCTFIFILLGGGVEVLDLLDIGKVGLVGRFVKVSRVVGIGVGLRLGSLEGRFFLEGGLGEDVEWLVVEELVELVVILLIIIIGGIIGEFVDWLLVETGRLAEIDRLAEILDGLAEILDELILGGLAEGILGVLEELVDRLVGSLIGCLAEFIDFLVVFCGLGGLGIELLKVIFF